MSAAHPLVSIITPSFNQAPYLEYTIQSVLRQEYPHLEYLVIDGGSTDGSLAILEKYAGRFAWWVSEADHGQAEAINKGFRRAKGEIIAWLNSDDLYLPGAIHQAVAALHQNPEADMVFGDALTIDSTGKPLNELRFGDWGLEEFKKFRMICQPAVFMRRKALPPDNLLDESYHFMLDHQLWLNIASRHPVRHAPALWAAARHHPQAKNAAQAARFSAETLRLLDWMQADPIFQARNRLDYRKMAGGAYRLSARYLLDGGQAGPALRDYLRALVNTPGYALRHWHRMAYAMMSLIGLRQASQWYYRLNKAPDLSGYPQLHGWPGLAANS
ncbi:MAG: glycosyltransferase family 2 protein [Anaerolineales bacterium]|jgi:glycosyltransferase involved in cell wall biosynthesis